MNDYDTRHLRLLDLIEAKRWTDLTIDDIQEMRVLIACKYLVLHEPRGQMPSVTLNPDGHHYHRSLSNLAAQRARLAS